MSGVDGITLSAAQALTESSDVRRFIPEPKTSRSMSFGGIVRRAQQMLTEEVAGAAGIDPKYQEFIDKQVELYEQMLLVSLTSNIEKARHETNMAAVRNMRVA